MKASRKNIRLKFYDYSSNGAYFITICTQERKCLFGEIVDGEMILNKYGEIVKNIWNELPLHYNHVKLDLLAIMPNHIHDIVLLSEKRAGFKPAPTEKPHSLSEIIRGFKTFSARRINEIRHITGISVWQRGFYEHVIRNEKSLDIIRHYVINNPLDEKMDWNALDNL